MKCRSIPATSSIVPQSGWNKTGVVIQQMTPFLTMATFAAIAIQ